MVPSVVSNTIPSCRYDSPALLKALVKATPATALKMIHSAMITAMMMNWAMAQFRLAGYFGEPPTAQTISMMNPTMGIAVMISVTIQLPIPISRPVSG